MRRYVKFFRELGQEDFQIAGGKAANLGELTKNELVKVFRLEIH